MDNARALCVFKSGGIIALAAPPSFRVNFEDRGSAGYAGFAETAIKVDIFIGTSSLQSLMYEV